MPKHFGHYEIIKHDASPLTSFTAELVGMAVSLEEIGTGKGQSAFVLSFALRPTSTQSLPGVSGTGLSSAMR